VGGGVPVFGELSAGAREHHYLLRTAQAPALRQQRFVCRCLMVEDFERDVGVVNLPAAVANFQVFFR
jgi:hypothetical protein